MWKRWQRTILIGLVVSLAALVGGVFWWSSHRPVDGNGRPRLAVVLVFDQMRGDYLQKWQGLFGEGGFKRLMNEGAWFSNCHYPYAFTVTSVGHTSLLTGCTPRDHGIVANSWFDRRLRKVVTSTIPDNSPNPSPTRRRQPTLGDVLLRRFGKSKVASLSIKETAAILMAAFKAQICYWLGGSDFKTSDYYPSGPHHWVIEFNAGKKIDTWIGRPWDFLRPDINNVKFIGPDDVDFEKRSNPQGWTFPHPTPSIAAVVNSPWGNELLLEFAKTAITAEKLGQRDEPDLLCISFSSNDSVGHGFGPDSQEVFDMTLRSDLIVKELLDFLDEKVGKGNYVVALSADHGVCSNPIIAHHQGKDAGYVPYSVFTTDAEKFLKKTFGQTRSKRAWLDGGVEVPVGSFYSTMIHLDPDVVKDLEPGKQEKIENALIDWLGRHEGVQAAYARRQLLSDEVQADPFAEKVRQSSTPDSCGEVVAILKPYYYLGNGLSTPFATHGSPHFYDTHVPFKELSQRLSFCLGYLLSIL